MFKSETKVSENNRNRLSVLAAPYEGRCISRCVLWLRKTQPQVKPHPPALSD